MREVYLRLGREHLTCFQKSGALGYPPCRGCRRLAGALETSFLALKQSPKDKSPFQKVQAANRLLLDKQAKVEKIIDRMARAQQELEAVKEQEADAE